MVFLPNRALFEIEFAQELAKTAHAPGGEKILCIIVTVYCNFSTMYHGAGLGFPACMNNRAHDCSRCGAGCGIRCSAMCVACHAIRGASEIQRQRESGELRADEATAAEEQLNNKLTIIENK